MYSALFQGYQLFCVVRQGRVVSTCATYLAKITDFPLKYSSNEIENRQNKTARIIERAGDVGRFSMVLPPPNITGNLHLGHALTVAIEDCIVRWNAMRGLDVLWIPGLDHAGIATQNVLERMCGGTKNRKEMLNIAEIWRSEKESVILDQLRRLGPYMDFSRKVFTLDPKMSMAVNEAFIRLFNQGLIYRANKLVNWCYFLQSTVSDIEVEHITVKGGGTVLLPGVNHLEEVGYLEKFAYPIDGGGEIDIVTGRLETMLDDVAVAVHPNDSRYTHFVGKQCIHPINGRRLPIIASEKVDMAYGSGALKLTPTSSSIDFEICATHNLLGDLKSSFKEDGSVCGDVPFLAGTRRQDVKVAVRQHLRFLSLYRGRRKTSREVPVCRRSGDLIDMKIKPQWFLRCDQLAEKALNAAEQGDLEFQPAYFVKIWRNWLTNISDWCISRQLWWGHQIPAYRCTIDGKETWVAAMSIGQALTIVEERYGITLQEEDLIADEDVLDTWFSSGLFPFAALGWPNETNDLKRYYPLSLMETGHDIIFFWVARMVMLSLALTGQLPFKKVLLHGMLRDAKGRKMSKSLGNVLDPMYIIEGRTLAELIEDVDDLYRQGYIDASEMIKAKTATQSTFPKGIPPCGADSLRFALLQSSDVLGDTIRFNVKDVDFAHRFCNKIWQGVRFYLGVRAKIVDEIGLLQCADTSKISVLDRWILSQLCEMIGTVNDAVGAYRLHDACVALQLFWIQAFCDVYLEAVKPSVNGGNVEEIGRIVWILRTCVDNFVLCMTPVMPLLAEELYQRLNDTDKSVMNNTFPIESEFVQWRDPSLNNNVAKLLSLLPEVRKLRSQCGVKLPKMFVYFEDEDLFKVASNIGPSLARLMFASEVQVCSQPMKCPVGFMELRVEDGTVFVETSQSVAVNLV